MGFKLLFFHIFGKHENTIIVFESIISFGLKVGLSIIKERNEDFASSYFDVSAYLFEASGLIVERDVFVVEFDLRGNTEKVL